MDRKGVGTNNGEWGIWRPRVSEAASTGGCVKLKTVTEIRQSSTHDTFIAENVYLVLNSSLDWEPVEKLKQKCDVVSFTSSSFFFSFFSFLGRGEQYSSVCYEGSGQRKQAGQKGENCSSLGVTEWEVASFTVASVERYFRTELIRQSW